jgi:hypothetical protein
MKILERVGELVMPLLQQWQTQKGHSAGGGGMFETDADGFVHVRHSKTAAPEQSSLWSEEIGRFVSGLYEAALKDLAHRHGTE